MGCGTSRATPVASQGLDEREQELQYDQQRRVASPASTAASATGTPPPSGPKAAANKSTPGGTAKGAGDDNVALALRSKRKGFVVEGTSVQVDSNYQRRVIAKDQAIKDMILAALKDNMLFSGYGVESLKAMIDAMEPREVEAGTVIIQQGEPGDNFYAIESGKVSDKLACSSGMSGASD